ncbi:HAD-IA family hydrolase [Streptomyces prunicolor]|uniref:HAD-IA family hydrolase n=1 Tax=Streptomyces prunicolor TaxID=67348 RepID=UPI0003643944|nr:HAD-IA family hydrolase [Streptomyces prunicolor]
MTADGSTHPATGCPTADDALETGTIVLACDRVLFDCDGVLVASTTAGETAWTQWATEHGLEPALVLDGVHGRRSADTVALFLPPERRHDALARIEAIEITGVEQCTPIPGAAALLTGLTGEWAVVTSATRALVGARLKAAGLPQPPVLITGDDVDRGKPAPDGYAEAARRLGVPVHACAIVEDSPTGIRAGRAAGAGHLLGVGETALATAARTVVKDLSGVSWTGDGLRVEWSSLLRPMSTSCSPASQARPRRHSC